MQRRGTPLPSAAGVDRLRAVLAALVVVAGVWVLREAFVEGRGLSADYGFVTTDGRRQSVTSQIDPAVWLPRPAAFYPPYLRAWDSARFGFPAARPRLDVKWTGFLHVERPGRRVFAVTTSGNTRLEVGSLVLQAGDGTRSASAEFAPGDYPIRIHFREGGRKPSLQITEALGPGRGRPLTDGLEPDAPMPLSSRRGLLVAALVFLCCVAGTVALGHGGKAPRRPLPWVGLAILALLALNLTLRFYDRAAVPSYTETADEYYQAWAGWSLLHGKAPVGWSWAPAYGHPDVRQFFGEPYPLVVPFLDHPPLSPVLSTLVGSVAARFTGRPMLADHFPFNAPPLEAIRAWPILCSTLTLFLLLQLGRRQFGAEIALAAGLLYATTPLWIAQQRLVKEEALLAPVLVAVLLLVLQGRERPGSCLRLLGKRDAASLFGLAALCPLLKATAAIVPLAIGGIVFPVLMPGARAAGGRTNPSPPRGARRRAGERGPTAGCDAASEAGEGVGERTSAKRIVLWSLIGTVVGLLLLFGYAAALDWRLFWQVQSWLGNKPTGPLAALGVLTQATVAHLRPAGHGWTLWMWMAALPALALHQRPLAWTVLLYLLVLTAFANPQLLYGWYMLPVQPLLALGAARLLLPASTQERSSLPAALWEKAELRLAGCGLALFWVLYVGASLFLLDAAAQFSLPAKALYAAAATGLIPFVWPTLSHRGWRGIVWATLAAAALLNIQIALHLRLYY